MARGSTRPDDLDQWFDPFLAVLRPSERKSLLSMAEQPGLSEHDQLQHFVVSPA